MTKKMSNSAVRTKQIDTIFKTPAALRWKISVPLLKNFQLQYHSKKLPAPIPLLKKFQLQYHSKNFQLQYHS